MKPPTYRLGDVCVDLDRVRVTRAGEPVDLEPKAFDVLRALLERPDRLVTKDELLTLVWPDTFVTPNVLTRAVAQLRKALGDDAAEARYIETVTKRGYRFIGQLASDDVAPGVEVAIPPVPSSMLKTPPGKAWVLALGGVLAVAILGWLAIPSSPTDSRAAVQVTTKRLTLRNGNNAMPSLSPDGSLVAFVSDVSGNLEIHVAGTTLGSRDIALTDDDGQNREPAWSPDGKWIAFHSRARGGVWIVPATGGPSAQVIEEGSMPAWSADSAWLVFSTTEGGMAGHSQLKAIRRDGTGLRTVTRLGQPLGGHVRPAWSHNGRFIAFTVTNATSTSRAWIVPAEGGHARELPAVGWSDHIAFGKDDRAVYLTGGAPERKALYRLELNVDGAPVGVPTELVVLTSGSFSGLSVSDNDTVAYSVATTDGNLWSVDVQNALAVAEPVRLTGESIRATNPLFSPSASKLAFVQTGTGVQRSIWLMNVDSMDQEALFADGLSASPSWTDDGRLLVLRAMAHEQARLWWFDTRTHRATQLTEVDTNGLNGPRISPDGRDIAYWRLEPNGAMNTWIQAAAGGAPRRLTSDPEAANYPAWSPDGRWLAVEIKRGERTHIGMVSRDGGPIEQLTNAPGQSWPHSWMPDSDSIVFAGEREGVWNVFTVSRSTRAVRQLTHFDSPSGYVRYPAASPDGRRVVFERQIDEGGIWTIDAAAPRGSSSS
ncbi:MAG: winged helix-turn-helix domain-containing protein [Vicinamibacterales bacterium]